MNDEEMRRVVVFAAALLRRMGGTVHIDEDELVEAQVFFDDSGDGMTAHLIPDYVQLGEEPEPAPAPNTFNDQELADLLKEMKKYAGTKDRMSALPRLYGSDGKLYIDQPDGSRIPVATKVEWALTRDGAIEEKTASSVGFVVDFP